jgi:hypothetical protein
MLSTSVVVTQIRSTLCSELVSCTITTLALTFVAGASVNESQAFDDGVSKNRQFLSCGLVHDLFSIIIH